MPSIAFASLTDDRRLEAADPAERHRAALWRYARVLGADGASADDLVQEAFLVAVRRPDFEARDEAAAFAFLRTTVRHLWLRSRRRRTADREVDEADAVWRDRCGDGLGDDYVDALRACLDRLPSRSRDLLVAFYADGAGRTGTGRRLGLGRDGVKSALRRLRTFLHECITKRMEASR